MDFESWSDEGVGWPSYVDFLATFAFVLFLFIGSLLFLMHGQVGERAFANRMAPYVDKLRTQGIDVAVEGMRVKYDLRKQVDFGSGSAELAPKHMAYLRRVARHLPEGLKQAGDCKVVVLGKADRIKFKNDPFGNWSLSAERALAVLKFLYNCENCGYGQEMRGRLTLLGEGDVAAKTRNSSAEDRRVDVVIDCTREVVR